MKDNKERILLYLLQLIDRDDPRYAKKTVDTFSVSTSTVYNYVQRLIRDGKLIRDPEKRTGMSLPEKRVQFTYGTDAKLSEDRIFQKDIEPLLAGVPQNVYRIWYYCFTEMMNNAIEHSGAKTIACSFTENALETRIVIVDDGIGIFKNIRNYLFETTGEDVPERECAGYLLAGRFTTAKERHTGEGIFFTSHLLDRFAILSSGVVFTRSDFSDAQSDLPDDSSGGTVVYMALSNTSPKRSADVFDRFSDVETGFSKTEIPMAHLFPNGYPVSRSEARRLFGMIRDFREVTLDFTGIENVGQAFVHEFFVLLPGQNPEQTVTLKNVADPVGRMILRVKNTASPRI
ncbi:MAG: DUF4325 domain-containing protein [Clostridia bacterium]|nr:DUF4325 domain-containing protein [Clostridia bacterium]MBR5044144.1 DUF4325 domain-containing protein [Clostridia bacterium]